MEYQTNDFVFDIEIRKNFFVLTQFFPAQHKFLISYIDGLKAYQASHVNTTDTTYQAGDFLSQYNMKWIQAFIKRDPNEILQKAEASNYGLITYFKKKIIPALIKDKRGDEGKISQIINNANRTVVRNKDNVYEFENLSNPYNLAAFAKRYGVVNNNYQSAIQGWSKNRSDNDLTPTLMFNMTNNCGKGKLNNLQEASEIHSIYYPPKKVDPSSLPNENGLRIGYNSESYDQTMIAELLTNFSVTPKLFYNLLALNDDTLNKFLQQQDEETAKNVKLLYIRMIQDFFGHLSNFQPDKLVEANNRIINNHFSNRAVSQYAHNLTVAYKNSNRFVDVMLLFPHPQPLKLVAGMLGYQIKESSTNEDPNVEIPTLDLIGDLIAYNVSDVYVTKMIFDNKSVQSTFSTRTNLIKEHPNLTFAQLNKSENAKDKLLADVGNLTNLRYNPITVNTTNPRIVENILAPYPNTKLVDSPVINYMYPSQEKVDELIKTGKAPKDFKPFDVLEDTRKFAEKTIGWEKFKPIYEYYSQFRGANFNREQDIAISHHKKVISWKDDKVNPKGETSLDNLKQHAKLAGLTDQDSLHFIDAHGKEKVISYETFTNKNVTTLPIKSAFGFFYDKNFQRTSAYYKATYGGLHGAEYKKRLFEMAQRQWIETAKAQTGIHQNNQLFTYKTINEIIDEWLVEPQEKRETDLLNTLHKPHKNNNPKIESFVDINEPQNNTKSVTIRPKKGELEYKKNSSPTLFTTTKLAKQYTFTSTGLSMHQDFSSYYPTLVVMLKIAKSVNGKDYYEGFYYERLHNKQESKNPNNPPEVRKAYKVKQAPQKLALNSLTGISDVQFKSKTRMNNNILKMRIIGELFAWRIGQALALKNARIVSTNTDGLYTMDLDPKDNDDVIKEQTAHIFLQVGPEKIDNFISKDTNNRLEFNDGKIQEAKGTTLTAWNGPDLSKRLTHPAITDRVLAEYLSSYDDSCNKEFNHQYAMSLLDQFKNNLTQQGISGKREFLRYMQWITRSNMTGHRYIIGLETNDKIGQPIDSEQYLKDHKIHYLEQTNRMFLIDQQAQKALEPEKTPLTLIMATADIVSKKSEVEKHIKAAFDRLSEEDPFFEHQVLPDLNYKYENFLKLLFDPFSAKENSNIDYQNYNQQEKLAINDPIANIVMHHYLNEAQLKDDEHGLEGHEISLDPKGDTSRNKIYDYKLTKVTDFPTNHIAYINNEAIDDYSEETIDKIINGLDYDAYIDIVNGKFSKNWKN